MFLLWTDDVILTAKLQIIDIHHLLSLMMGFN